MNAHSHPSCGEVSHNVTISGNVVYPDTVGGSQYTIDGLQSDTLYNITVTSTHNGSIRIFNKDVRTILPVCKSYSYVHSYVHDNSMQYVHKLPHMYVHTYNIKMPIYIATYNKFYIL